MSDLETARECIRKQLLADNAPGILGAGIDLTISKLIVFFSDEAVAVPFLRTLLGDKFSLVLLVSGERRPAGTLRCCSGSLRVFGKLRLFLRRFRLLAKILPVPRSTKILPLDGNSGRLGCFVKIGADVVALTAGHLFTYRDPGNGDTNIIFACDEFGKCDQDNPIGATLDFSSLKVGANATDIAILIPNEIPNESSVKRVVVASAELAGVEGGMAKSLAPLMGKGTVLDSRGIIKYEVFDGRILKEYIFNDQILFKNFTKSRLGVQGDSGVLIVLGEAVGNLAEGSILGVYSWTTFDNAYHFAVPMFACVNEFGIAAIYNS